MKTIAALALLSQAVTTPASVPQEPIGKWAVDYADTACILSRDYGPSDALTTLRINPSPLAAGLELATIAPGAKTTRYRPMKGTLTLQPSGQTITTETSVYELKDKNQTITTLRVDAASAAEMLRSTSLSIALANGSRSAFAVPGMKGAASALTACQDDLLRRWGIDPAERNLPPLAAASGAQGDWISMDDYPAAARNAREHGAVTIVWTVRTDGTVGDCRSVHSSGSKALDDAACSAITKRGRYAPPLGADGKPQVRHGMRNVVWILPS